jgi:hypothetical protein
MHMNFTVLSGADYQKHLAFFFEDRVLAELRTSRTPSSEEIMVGRLGP